MADRLDEILQRLAVETDALPKATPTSLPAWNFVNYRNKNADRYDQDQRRAHFLKGVREQVKGENLHALASQYPGVLDAMDPEKVRNLESAYEPYGEDHPVWNSLVWMQSLPSAVYATGQMLANKVDPEANPYPDAPRQFAKSVNTFTGGLTEGALPKNLSRWRDLQDMRDKMNPNWRVLDPSVSDAMTKYEYQPDVLSGEQFLRGAGVPDTAAKYGGAAMDTFIDPYSSLPAAAALARAGRGWAAMGQLAPDVALGVGLTAVPDAIEAGKKIRDLINPAY